MCVAAYAAHAPSEPDVEAANHAATGSTIAYAQASTASGKPNRPAPFKPRATTAPAATNGNVASDQPR